MATTKQDAGPSATERITQLNDVDKVGWIVFDDIRTQAELLPLGCRRAPPICRYGDQDVNLRRTRRR